MKEKARRGLCGAARDEVVDQMRAKRGPYWDKWLAAQTAAMQRLLAERAKLTD